MVSRNSNNNNNNNNNINDAEATRQAREATTAVQDDTLDAISRISQQATETADIGATTLDELYKQRQQLEQTQEATDRLHAGLDRTEQLQNRLSRWGGISHWGKRGEAKKQVKQEAKKEQGIQARRQQQRDIVTVESSTASSSAASPSSDVVIEKRKKNKGLRGWNNKKEENTRSQAGGGGADSKTLGSVTYGLNDHKNSCNNDPEHDDYLRRVEETDQTIDAGLSSVNAQLDHLLDLATTMKSEVRNQEQVLTNVDDQMQEANQKQKVASKRLGRFFSNNKTTTDNGTSITGSGSTAMAAAAAKSMLK